VNTGHRLDSAMCHTAFERRVSKQRKWV
jgi:hypothetical protein